METSFFFTKPAGISTSCVFCCFTLRNCFRTFVLHHNILCEAAAITMLVIFYNFLYLFGILKEEHTNAPSSLWLQSLHRYSSTLYRIIIVSSDSNITIWVTDDIRKIQMKIQLPGYAMNSFTYNMPLSRLSEIAIGPNTTI